MRFLPLHDAPIAHGPAFEQVIREFYITGRSVHSLDGTLLAPLLNYLRESKIPFTLRYVPGGGYYVERGSGPVYRSTPPLMNDPESIRRQQELLHGHAQPDLSNPPADGRDLGGPDHHGRHEDAMSLVDIIAAHIQATKGSDLSSDYLRLTEDQWQRLRAYAHREQADPADPARGPYDTLMGLPVEIIGSYEDRAREARGQRGFTIPNEAIAPKE